jgi:predicted DNA-binding ribbon-helix-helix protein
MKTLGIKKRSIIIDGHKTSVSLENEFWECLRKIADSRRMPLSHLITDIDAKRKFCNLSSAIRMFILRHYRDQLDQRGGVITAPAPSKSIEHTARR